MTKIERKIDKNKKIKRKVQVVVYSNLKKKFLALRTNQERGHFWQNITGGVDEGENFDQAAQREVLEEIGFEIKHKQDLFIDLNFEFHFETRYSSEAHEKAFLLILNSDDAITLDGKEHDLYQWIDGKECLAQNLFLHPSNLEALEKGISFIENNLEHI